MDILQFMMALRLASRRHYNFDYFLKIHSKSSLDWRRHALDSLCGTPAQVLTVMNAFRDKTRNVGVIVPQGLVIKKSIDLKELYAPLRTYYSGAARGAKVVDVFNKQNVDNMKAIYRQMFKEEIDPDTSKYVCNAGTMFWAKYDDFQAKRWCDLLPWLRGKWTDGYIEDGGVEHAIERLFVTIPFIRGVGVAQIVPAPKPISVYFPQYHSIPENDQIHGAGFTEWTLLKPSPVPFLAKPLPVSEGGLGYYNLTDISVRRRQAALARAAGVYGFMFYHYWFAGSDSSNSSNVQFKNPVMGKIAELMLVDGEPNLPFMFSWANEPWTSTWSGGDGHVLLPQNYGGPEEWTRHFNYLLPFFRHRNHMRVREKPVFVIYRIGLMRRVLRPMLQLWRDLAAKAGLPGLYIIYTLNNFASKDKIYKFRDFECCDASFQFFPTVASSFRAAINLSSSVSNLEKRDRGSRRQYWGGYTSFSNRVRRLDNKSYTRLVSPKEFSDGLRLSFSAMATTLPSTKQQVNNPNFFFITAWNEWNEQAQLEPSDMHRFGYLSAVKSNVEEFPIQLIT